MKLNEAGLANRKEWEEKGYALPKFDRTAVTENTKKNPRWIHFGAGNIFRAFQANVVQNLLNEGILDTLYAYPFPVVMVSVTDRSLRLYERKHIAKQNGYHSFTLFLLTRIRNWSYCTPFPNRNDSVSPVKSSQLL